MRPSSLLAALLVARAAASWPSPPGGPPPPNFPPATLISNPSNGYAGGGGPLFFGEEVSPPGELRTTIYPTRSPLTRRDCTWLPGTAAALCGTYSQNYPYDSIFTHLVGSSVPRDICVELVANHTPGLPFTTKRLRTDPLSTSTNELVLFGAEYKNGNCHAVYNEGTGYNADCLGGSHTYQQQQGYLGIGRQPPSIGFNPTPTFATQTCVMADGAGTFPTPANPGPAAARWISYETWSPDQAALDVATTREGVTYDGAIVASDGRVFAAPTYFGSLGGGPQVDVLVVNATGATGAPDRPPAHLCRR